MAARLVRLLCPLCMRHLHLSQAKDVLRSQGSVSDCSLRPLLTEQVVRGHGRGHGRGSFEPSKPFLLVRNAKGFLVSGASGEEKDLIVGFAQAVWRLGQAWIDSGLITRWQMISEQWSDSLNALTPIASLCTAKTLFTGQSTAVAGGISATGFSDILSGKSNARGGGIET